MKSIALPSFWEAYDRLDIRIKKRVQKAYTLWSENPFHPSLHFKCINAQENIWSVRITRGIRAVGVMEGDEVVWFWVGNHDAYSRFYGGD